MMEPGQDGGGHSHDYLDREVAESGRLETINPDYIGRYPTQDQESLTLEPVNEEEFVSANDEENDHFERITPMYDTQHWPDNGSLSPDWF